MTVRSSPARMVSGPTVLIRMPMARFLLVPTCAAMLVLLGCTAGDDDALAPAAPVPGEESAGELPAPQQAVGPVTGMPDDPGPGAVPLGGTPPAPPPDLAELAGVGPVNGLEALQDNPEAGLGLDPPADSIGAVPAAPSIHDAVAAVEAYYRAIATGDFGRAYAAWSDGGRASGRTPEQFAAGFRGHEVLAVSVGEPGRIEGAAGSLYVEVPVTVTLRGPDGREVRQAGGFVMRSGQVDGAARGWHIASAALRELQP